MQPTLQMSMLVLYVRDPRSTSGARYHNVTTWRHQKVPIEPICWTAHTSLLNVFTGTPNALASPKSPILSSPRRLINKFCGLRSRCNTRLSWQKAIPWDKRQP